MTDEIETKPIGHVSPFERIKRTNLISRLFCNYEAKKPVAIGL